MPLTPVEATLIGTALGAGATTLTGLLTQRATRKREQEARLWNRRADAFEELLRSVSVMERARREMVRSRVIQPVIDEHHDSLKAVKADVQLRLYGSEQLRDGYSSWFEAEKVWFVAFLAWASAAGPNQERAGDSEAEEKWAAVEVAHEACKVQDAAFVAQLRAAALQTSASRWKWPWW